MKYEILGIYGVDDAILGLSLSYNVALDKARLAAEKLIKINTDNLNELNIFFVNLVLTYLYICAIIYTEQEIRRTKT